MAKTKIKLKTVNELGVVLEDMNSKFNILIEGHQALDEKFDKFKRETDSNFKTVFECLSNNDDFNIKTEDNFKTVFEKLSNIDDFNIKTEDNFKTVFEKLSNIKSEIINIKKKLVNKVDISRAVVLEKKVDKIEIGLLRLQAV